MSRRMVALVLVWCAVAAPGPATTRLPAAAVRALDNVSAADLRRYVERLTSDAIGLTLQEDYDRGSHRLLQRSDHWPFLAGGIPALFRTSGLHPDYHTPDDDTARIDFWKLTRVTRLAARAAWIVADGPEPSLNKR